MSQEAKVLFGIGITAVLLVVGSVFFFTKSVQAPTTDIQIASNSPYLVRSDSHQTASLSASLKVTVVEFGDYQCPACGAAYPITKHMLSDYSGRINFVFRNFPLPQHQYAQLAAEVAEEAGDQGKFWQMHDKLYETQNDWANSNQPLDLFIGYAKDLGLNITKFQADVTANKFSSRLRNDQNDGNSLGINQTPTFFINGQELAGVPTYYNLKSIIDSDLSR